MPGLGADISGNTRTSVFRLRPSWFGVVLEEKIVTNDGETRWVKSRRPVPLASNVRD